MATIYIDNEPGQANPRQNLLHACLSLGYDLPYFCWHPALGSVGACRQCAVKQFSDEQDTAGKVAAGLPCIGNEDILHLRERRSIQTAAGHSQRDATFLPLGV